MGAAARFESSDMTTTPARPTQVVDVNDWLERATDPARGFTPSLCEYVPRHRAVVAEAALGA
jgi:hypothetical protein